MDRENAPVLTAPDDEIGHVRLCRRWHRARPCQTARPCAGRLRTDRRLPPDDHHYRREVLRDEHRRFGT